MSTLKVSNINNASATSGGLAIDSSGVVTGALPYPNRNLLYNGAMQVAQRGTSATGITTIGYYTADRWYTEISSLGTWTQDIQNDAPTGSGFRRSVRLLCTTADASPAAGDYLIFQQLLEGQDVQRIRKGTSSAQKLTLSFWVKSNVTGTYIAELADTDNTRRISASYSVSASATWERKTVTFSADTTGAFNNDNGLSLSLLFWLGAGSNFTGGSPLQTTWGTATNTRATGQTNLAAATNNYWQITGVQLEVGDTATEFEHLPFGVELARCQRYYYRTAGGVYCRFGSGFNYSTTVANVVIHLPVTMRTTPTAIETTGTAANYALYHGSGTVTALSNLPTLDSTGSGTNSITVNGLVASGLTAGGASLLLANNTASVYLGFSAEL